MWGCFWGYLEFPVCLILLKTINYVFYSIPIIGTTSASSMFTQVLRKLSFSRFIPFFHYLIFNAVPVNRHHLVYIRTYLLFGLKGIPTTSTASCSQKNDIRLRIFLTKIYFEYAGWEEKFFKDFYLL